ncbi:MAG: LamG-like jellyroll fold domain-containing protein [Verrucomicrobiota bacterium]
MKFFPILIFAACSPFVASADLSTGLVAFYAFDGNGADSSSSGLNLVNHSVTYQSGLHGQAASFDGLHSYYETAQSFPLIGNSSRTMDVWLYANSFSGFQSVFQYGDYNQLGGIWGMNVLPPSSGVVYANFGNIVVSSQPNHTAYGTGQWFNLAASYDGSTHATRIYINGMYVGGDLILGTTASGLNTTSGPLDIGYNAPGFPITGNQWYSAWNGLMDDLRIYNRALTDSEIAQLAIVPEPSSIALLTLGLLVVRARSGLRK